MSQPAVLTPAFGQADLSNCEREQIHLAASIQPHGALLLVREPDLVIVQESANAAHFLGLEAVEAAAATAPSLLGRPLGDISADLVERLRAHLGEPLDILPIPIRCHVNANARDVAYDGLVHRPPGGGLVIELERAGPSVDLDADVAKALQPITTAGSIRALCDETARVSPVTTPGPHSTVRIVEAADQHVDLSPRSSGRGSIEASSP